MYDLFLKFQNILKDNFKKTAGMNPAAVKKGNGLIPASTLDSPYIF
jgi:hypothetical protein